MLMVQQEGVSGGAMVDLMVEPRDCEWWSRGIVNGGAEEL